jgi:hypothetical protein
MSFKNKYIIPARPPACTHTCTESYIFVYEHPYVHTYTHTEFKNGFPVQCIYLFIAKCRIWTTKREHTCISWQHCKMCCYNFYCTAQSSVIINQIMLKIQVTVIWCHVNWQTVKLCSHIQWTNLLILPNMIRCIRGSGKNVIPWVQLMDINILEQSYSNCIPKAHFLYNKVDIHNSDNNMLYFLFSLLSFSM